MMRLTAALAALALFAIPVLVAPSRAVALGGALALVVAALGIATLWRWPVTVAACAFLTDYAVALWRAGASVSVVEAAIVGVAVLVLLQAVEIARCARRAVLAAGVVRWQLIGWTAFAAATVGGAAVVMVGARLVATAVPFAAAPVVAAVGALGVIVALAGALARPVR
jgi:hypothetical protein